MLCNKFRFGSFQFQSSHVTVHCKHAQPLEYSYRFCLLYRKRVKYQVGPMLSSPEQCTSGKCVLPGQPPALMTAATQLGIELYLETLQ